MNHFKIEKLILNDGAWLAFERAYCKCRLGKNKLCGVHDIVFFVKENLRQRPNHYLFPFGQKFKPEKSFTQNGEKFYA